MATREEYTDCMIPHMKGGGPDRKLRFCTGAKLCSGKAKTKAEAEQLCQDQPLKESKPRKTRSPKCITDPASLASCIIDQIGGASTTENLEGRLEQAIIDCTATKKPSPPASHPPTYTRFMNSCLKEAGAGGDFAASQPVIKKCQTEWTAQRGA